MTGWIVAILLLSGLIGLHLGWRRRYRLLALGQAAKPAGVTDALGVTDMFENMAEGVLVTNQKGIIEFANPSFCKLFELAAEPKDQTVMEAIRIHEVHALVNLLRQNNQVVQEEIMLPNLDQQFLQVNGVAIRDRNENHRGAIFVFHDLTRLKRLENLRQEFVANVSHELRTPLSIIKGYVETLLDAETDAESLSHRFLKKIENHSNRLTFLIEDILALSHLESGDIGLDQREVNVRQLAEGVLDGLREMADKKKGAPREWRARKPHVVCRQPATVSGTKQSGRKRDQVRRRVRPRLSHQCEWRTRPLRGGQRPRHPRRGVRSDF